MKNQPDPHQVETGGDKTERQKSEVTPEQLRDDLLLVEVMEQRLSQIDKQMEYILKNKPIPPHLDDPKWANNIADKILAMDLPLDERKSALYRAAAECGYRFAVARTRFNQI